MKKMNSILAIALLGLVFTACKKQDKISDLTITETENLAIGSWKVSYYYDNSNGVSNDFDGYTFDISSDGTFIANMGGVSFNGLWLVKNSDDDPQYNNEIEFTVSGDTQMDKLNCKWLVVEITETSMNLKDDTPSEEIQFQKN